MYKFMQIRTLAQVGNTTIFKNVTCNFQQALREVTRTVGPVVKNIEYEAEPNAGVLDMPESIGMEPKNDSQDQDRMCSKCYVLADKVVKLQKKISWLKKSKKRLNDSLNVVYILTSY